MKNVLLRAPLLTNSGYGVHSRQIFEWLMTRKDFNVTTQALKWGLTPWLVNPNDENGLVKKIMERAKNIEGQKFDLTFQVQLPDEWDESLGKVNIGVTALVETDKCNPAWFDKIKKMDHVVVPSKFTKKVITDTFGTIFDSKVHVIPEWFNPLLEEDLKHKSKDTRLQFDTDFNLLTVGTLTSADINSDRKNVVNTIGWAIEALEGIPNTGIIVKTSFGRGSAQDREITKSVIDQIKKAFRKSDFPKIHLLHGNMKDSDLAALYQSGKVKGYVSATRGEGFGLPLIEAASSGIPVITTNWSGHLDFLEDDFLKVDYKLHPIPENRVDNRIFVPGTKWADPSKDSYIQNIKDLRENLKTYQERSQKFKKHVRHNFSREKICKKYDKFLKECFNL